MVNNVSLTVDVLYVVDSNGNQVVTAAGDEMVIDAKAQGMTQSGVSLTTDRPALSQRRPLLTT